MLRTLARLSVWGLLATAGAGQAGEPVPAAPRPSTQNPSPDPTSEVPAPPRPAHLPWNLLTGQLGLATAGAAGGNLFPVWEGGAAAPLSLVDLCCSGHQVSLAEVLQYSAPPPDRWLGWGGFGPKPRGLTTVELEYPDYRLLWLRGLFGLDGLTGARGESRDFDGKAAGRFDGPWGSLKTQVLLEEVVRCPDAPLTGERWQTEEELQVPVAGPLFVFGQFRAGYNTLTAQEASLLGHTGVGCKLNPLRGGEILLRGGSRRSYAADPLRPERLPRDKAEMVLELQARYSLLGPVKLEYQGAAMPALDPLERHRLNQDVRLAIPLGAAGDLRLGAKHQWEDQPVLRPWTEGMQLYLGVGLKR